MRLGDLTGQFTLVGLLLLEPVVDRRLAANQAWIFFNITHLIK